MSSVSVTNLNSLLVFPTGSWNLFYKDQRNEILDHVVNNAIRGVVFISGDLQFGTLARVEPIPTRDKDNHTIVEFGRYNISEVAVGPVGTRVRPEVLLNSRTAAALASGQFKVLIDTWTYTSAPSSIFFSTQFY